MPKKPLRKLWTKVETANLEKYIKSQSGLLKNNFYWNIYFGKMKRRRPARFFIEMGSRIGRTSSQCKSKFQKFEREIYVEYLEIPANHFQVYKAIRNRQKGASESGEWNSQKRRSRSRKTKQTRRESQMKSESEGDKVEGNETRANEGKMEKSGKTRKKRRKEAKEDAEENETNQVDLKKVREEIIMKIRAKEIKLKNFRRSKLRFFGCWVDYNRENPKQTWKKVATDENQRESQNPKNQRNWTK